MRSSQTNEACQVTFLRENKPPLPVQIEAITGRIDQNYRLIVTDITGRNQSEEALRKSERLYRAIGESIDYGVWVRGPDGCNVYASQSFLSLLGLTQEQYAAMPWEDVLHPDDIGPTVAAWKECVRSGRNMDIEHRFRGADGAWHPILSRGVPLRDKTGGITAWWAFTWISASGSPESNYYTLSSPYANSGPMDWRK